MAHPASDVIYIVPEYTLLYCEEIKSAIPEFESDIDVVLKALGSIKLGKKEKLSDYLFSFKFLSGIKNIHDGMKDNLDDPNFIVYARNILIRITRDITRIQLKRVTDSDVKEAITELETRRKNESKPAGVSLATED